MSSLDQIPMSGNPDKVLLNHSDQEYLPDYTNLCAKHGWVQEVLDNHGATRAKWNVIEHATSCGYEIASQVSEDFNVCCHSQKVTWLPTCPSFYDDSVAILKDRPNLTFVHWSFVTMASSVLRLDPHGHPANLRVFKSPNSKLAHVEGDVRLLNWPSTYKVARMKALLDEAKKTCGWSEENASRWADGGEWIMANMGFGQGGVLLAQPVDHDRPLSKKPSGSKA